MYSVRRHGWATPEPLEVRAVLFQEPLDERVALGAVGQELRAPLHGHAAHVAPTGPRLGHHAHAGVAAQVPHFLGARDTDHGQRRRVVQEPHRHGQGGAIGLHGGEQDPALGGEKPLDAGFVEAHVAMTRWNTRW
jgi:hypothetical protein